MGTLIKGTGRDKIVSIADQIAGFNVAAVVHVASPTPAVKYKMVLNVPKVKFYNGYEVPIFGLGTWKASFLSFGHIPTYIISYFVKIMYNIVSDIIFVT